MRRSRTTALVVSSVVVVVFVAATTARTAGTMSCGDSWIEDETSYPVMRRTNVTGLVALADRLLRTAAAADDDHDGTAAVTVDVVLRMNRRSGAARLNQACGYEVRVNGTGAAAAGTVSRSSYLPAYERAVCSDGRAYRVQFVRPGGAHRQTVRLPDGVAAVSSVELRANGKNYLTAESACVAVRGGGAAGARAFCVDLALLKSCRCLPPRPRSADYHLGVGGMSLAMSRWNVRDVVFRDVGALADGLGALARDPSDTDAQRAVCDRVRLVPGDLDAEPDTCPVERIVGPRATAATGADRGGAGSVELVPERMHVNHVLYACMPRPDDAAGVGGKVADDRPPQQRSGARAPYGSRVTWWCLFFRPALRAWWCAATVHLRAILSRPSFVSVPS